MIEGKLSRQFSEGERLRVKTPSRMVRKRPTYETGWTVVMRISVVIYQTVRKSGHGHSKLIHVNNLKAPGALGNQGSSSKQYSSSETFAAGRVRLQRTGSEPVQLDIFPCSGQELSSGKGFE